MAIHECAECGPVMVLHGRVAGFPCAKCKKEFEKEFGIPPTTEPRSLVKQVCKTCLFIVGAFAGAVVCVAVLQAKGLIL